MEIENDYLIEQVVCEVLKLLEKDVKIPTVDKTNENIQVEPIMSVLMENPFNAEALKHMAKSTSARIGLGRAGPRAKTSSLLTFWADHAKARDEVLKDVDLILIESLGLFEVSTKCFDRNQHLTRPDLGRQLSESAITTIKSRCKANPNVQIYVSDGLSSGAVESSVKDCLSSLMFGLEKSNLEIGTPFFLKFGRVPAMDEISELLRAEVICVLIGERPGLGSSESLSAYIAYQAKSGMPEARRTVVSNIHNKGFIPVEAGAYIAELIEKIIEKKVSGVDLKL